MAVAPAAGKAIAMPDEAKIVRQWRLLRILSARRAAAIRDLIDELSISSKTVRRDLLDLRDAGFPISEEIGAYGRKTYHIDSDAGLPSFGLCFDEALALVLSRSCLSPLAGTYFEESADEAYAKLRSGFADPVLEYLDKMHGRFASTTRRNDIYADKRDEIDDLLRAIEDCTQTIIAYQSANSTEAVEYEIYPYGLVSHRNGSLYLIAHSLRHDEVRNFKVDRLESVESLPGLPFERPADFDVREHLSGSLGIYQGDGDAEITVKATFSPTVAQYVRETIVHPSQTISSLPDGNLLVELRLTSTAEAKSWLLSFGPHAVVLEPPELRDEIAVDVQRMAAAYGVTRSKKRPERAKGGGR